jgi:hypothetical protein
MLEDRNIRYEAQGPAVREHTAYKSQVYKTGGKTGEAIKKTAAKKGKEPTGIRLVKNAAGKTDDKDFEKF